MNKKLKSEFFNVLLNLLGNMTNSIQKLSSLYIVKYQKGNRNSLRFLFFDQYDEIQFALDKDICEKFVPFSLFSLTTLLEAKTKFPSESIKLIEVGTEIPVWEK